ncbi:MAG: hypothetical protein IJX98_02750 [Clostridia bacterium]|nr:hypothetical protein [Clostridia bacterium]
MDRIGAMKEYLRRAVICERNLYIWSKAIEYANAKMEQIYQEHTDLERKERATKQELETVMSLPKQEKNQSVQIEKEKKKELITIICLIIFPLTTIIGLLMLFTRLWVDKKTLPQNSNELAKNSKGYRIPLLQEKLETISTALLENLEMEDYVAKKQEEIAANLRMAKQNLQQLYEMNVLPHKYRNFVAVATMYEYLQTGRCNTIEGGHGIYDTYENDLRLNMIICNLVEINKRLGRIEANQRVLYNALQEANRELSRLQHSLDNIDGSVQRMADNAQMAAEAAKRVEQGG